MKESLTDWERLDALQNEDIDLNEITAMHNRSGRERKSYYFYFYFASRARRMAHACREMVDSI